MSTTAHFEWQLEKLMHDRGIHQNASLQRRLEDLDINLSSSQVHRLVTQKPDRLNLHMLAALCEILDCSPSELIEISVRERQRKVVNDTNLVDLATTARPRRARVTRRDD